MAGGQCLDHLDKIFGPVIDAALGTQRFAGAAFFVGAGGGKYPVAERGRHLDRRHADTGTAALHQQGFTGRQVVAIEYIAPDRKKSLR